ncbi:hypothetical protein [Staphylococcus phage PT94]
MREFGNVVGLYIVNLIVFLELFIIPYLLDIFLFHIAPDLKVWYYLFTVVFISTIKSVIVLEIKDTRENK